MDEEDIGYDNVDDSNTDYETHIRGQRDDVRRKIEELLEQKRLREEFGDL